jgi:hypothetical protein
VLAQARLQISAEERFFGPAITPITSTARNSSGPAAPSRARLMTAIAPRLVRPSRATAESSVWPSASVPRIIAASDGPVSRPGRSLSAAASRGRKTMTMVSNRAVAEASVPARSAGNPWVSSAGERSGYIARTRSSARKLNATMPTKASR